MEKESDEGMPGVSAAAPNERGTDSAKNPPWLLIYSYLMEVRGSPAGFSENARHSIAESLACRDEARFYRPAMAGAEPRSRGGVAGFPPAGKAARAH